MEKLKKNKGKGKGKGKGKAKEKETAKPTKAKGKGKSKEKNDDDESEDATSNAAKEGRFIISYSGGNDADNISIVCTITDEFYDKFTKSHELVLKTFKLCKKINTTNMCLFTPVQKTDEDNREMKIVRYTSAEQIINEFYPLRLAGYTKRRAHYKKIYKTEIEFLTYKMKFINEVIEGTIVPFRKKKAELESILLAKEYKQYPATKDTKTESYQYLYSIRTDQYTIDEIEKLQNEIDKTNEQLNYYKNNTAQQIWLDDLDELEIYYNKHDLHHRNKNDEKDIDEIAIECVDDDSPDDDESSGSD